jgi:hypothetical protein
MAEIVNFLLNRPSAPEFSYEVTTWKLRILLDRLKTERIRVPHYQRTFVWSKRRQQLLIDKTKMRRALPGSILLRKHADGSWTLEDGLQRTTTHHRFVENVTTGSDGQFFNTMTDVEQERYLTTDMIVEVYENATDAEAIDIFINRQGGQPLTTVDRLHAMLSLSPLIAFAKEVLLTRGVGLNERGARVWGSRVYTDDKRGTIVDAVALVAGLAFGPDRITKTWSDIQVNGMLSDQFDRTAVTALLTKIIEIYERVQAIQPVPANKLASQWTMTNFNGYIAYSLHEYPDEHQRIADGWVRFICRTRTERDLMKNVLHADVTAARSWNVDRWKNGYLRVFEPAALAPALPRADDEESVDTDE